MEPRLVGTIEIDQDLSFQRRAWRAERVAWLVMGLLLVLATLGVFATGPLAHAEKDGAGGQFTVSYERFARHQGHGSWSVQIHDIAPGTTEVELFFSNSLIRDQVISQFTPQADEAYVTDDGVVYVFKLDPDLSSGPIWIQMHTLIEAVGMLDGEVGIVQDDGSIATVTIRTFVYP